MRQSTSLCQKVVDTREITERFKWDYRRTVADLIAQNYYGRLSTLSHERGLLTHPESGGPYEHYIDSMETEGINDVPMGEFWAMAQMPEELPAGFIEPFHHGPILCDMQ